MSVQLHAQHSKQLHKGNTEPSVKTKHMLKRGGGGGGE